MSILRSVFRAALLMGVATFAHAAIPSDPTEVKPLAVGEAFPAVSVESATGETVALADIFQKAPTALVFYRGGWCPYCNKQLAQLQKIEEDLLALGYQIVALSPDTPDKLAEYLEGKGKKLHYTLFSDASMEASKAAGLAYRVSDDMFARLQGYGVTLANSSGEAHQLLPVPAVFLLDPEGKILFRYFNPDYTERLSRKEVLAAAKKVSM